MHRGTDLQQQVPAMHRGNVSDAARACRDNPASTAPTTKTQLERSAGITTPGRGGGSESVGLRTTRIGRNDDVDARGKMHEADGITTPGRGDSEEKARALKVDGELTTTTKTELERGNVSDRDGQSNTRTTEDPAWQHAVSANEGRHRSLT